MNGWLDYVLVTGAGVICGFLNTLASSGSAVSLPLLLMLGLDPETANATNRLPVVVGAGAAVASFAHAGAIPWAIATRVAIPATIGSAFGAVLADYIPARSLRLAITAAILVALILLFTKVKDAINRSFDDPRPFTMKESLIFFGIGAWVGFIVLDSATYMLLALVLVVHLSLVQSNAIKNLVLIPTTAISLVVFARDGHVAWAPGGVMALGSIAGGLIAARLAMLPAAKVWVFRLLVVVIVGELIQISQQYIHKLA
jgi:hypothetical protein